MLLPCTDLTGEAPSTKDTRKIVLESSPDDMAAYLASEWLNTRLYMVLKDAKLAEFSARAMHLSSSQQNLEEHLKVLEKELNSVRKELIDKQGREASAAQSLRKRKHEALLKRSIQ